MRHLCEQGGWHVLSLDRQTKSFKFVLSQSNSTGSPPSLYQKIHKQHFHGVLICKVCCCGKQMKSIKFPGQICGKVKWGVFIKQSGRRILSLDQQIKSFKFVWSQSSIGFHIGHHLRDKCCILVNGDGGVQGDKKANKLVFQSSVRVSFILVRC